MAIPNDKIKHVVLLKLENHSFDQMLGCFNQIYPKLEGVSEENYNEDSKGNKFFQKPYFYQQMEIDPNHECVNVKEQLSNGNKGFVQNLERVKDCDEEQKKKIMAYYPMGSLPALHTLAKYYTICDHWFSSVPGPTWPNRFFALSGTTNGFVNMPEGGKDLEMAFNQNQPTLFDRLDEKGNIRWNVFYYDLPCSLILVHQRQAVNISKYKMIDEFFDLCENSEEKDFPEFAFIEPKYFGLDQNDDHPPHNVMKAQKLIADVYNAIRSNQELFESTLLVVNYDEHGGFYDHVVPPKAVPPDTCKDQYTFDQYGLRVPVLLISPWVAQGVDQTQFDHTSLLKYLTEKWDLGPLGARTADPRTNSIRNAISTTTMRNYNDLPAFIRISYSKLVSPRPDLEENSQNQHRDGLAMIFAGFQSGLLAAGVDAWSEFAQQWHKNKAIGDDWQYAKDWKYMLGTILMAGGRSLQAEGRVEIKQKEQALTDPKNIPALGVQAAKSALKQIP